MPQPVIPGKVALMRAWASHAPLWVAVVAVGISAALLIILHIYRPTAGNLWLDTFYNSLHVPTFWLIAIGVFTALGTVRPLSFGPRLAAATGIALLLGVISEVAQIRGPRDASFDDLLADWLGSISAILMIVAVTRKRGDSKHWRIYAYLSIGLLIFAMRQLLLVSAAYAERNSNVPVIVDFNSRFADTFFWLQDATLAYSDYGQKTGQFGTVKFGDGPWPGVIFHDIWPDWEGYESLAVELAINEGQSMAINIRIHDLLHRIGEQLYNDRFNRTYTLQSGSHTIRIPLDEIRSAPYDRELDLSKIAGMAIFATQRESGLSFDLLSIQLE